MVGTQAAPLKAVDINTLHAVNHVTLTLLLLPFSYTELCRYAVVY